MKKLKKICVVLFAMLVVATPVLTVNANAGINPDEQRILTALENANVPARYINQARNYAMRADVNITGAQADQIIGYIEEAHRLVTEAGFAFTPTTPNANVSRWPSSLRDRVIQLVHNAAAVINLTLDVNVTTGVVQIVDSQGNLVAETSPTIRATGFTATAGVTASFALVGVAGGTTFFAKKKAA